MKTFHSSRKRKAGNIDLSAGHAGPTNQLVEEDLSSRPDVCDVDALVALSKADVLISSSTFYWPKLGEQVNAKHRVHVLVSRVFAYLMLIHLHLTT